MSIQGTINQGISLVSLLVAQTPGAKRKEAEEAAARQQQISQASERGRQSGLQEAKKARAAQDLEEAKRLYGEHSALVKPKGSTAEKLETIEGHILSRRNAIESGLRLQKLEPSQEIGDQLGVWQGEIDELEEKKKGIYEAGRESRKKQREAERAAQERLEEERRRQELSRATTEPFNPTLDTIVKGGKFDGRKK